jgi:hypothetical protein
MKHNYINIIKFTSTWTLFNYNQIDKQFQDYKFAELAQTQTRFCSLSIPQTKSTIWHAALEHQQRPILFSSKHKEQKPKQQHNASCLFEH